jgi:hypothetical protein
MTSCMLKAVTEALLVCRQGLNGTSACFFYKARESSRLWTLRGADDTVSHVLQHNRSHPFRSKKFQEKTRDHLNTHHMVVLSWTQGESSVPWSLDLHSTVTRIKPQNPQTSDLSSSSHLYTDSQITYNSSSPSRQAEQRWMLEEPPVELVNVNWRETIERRRKLHNEDLHNLYSSPSITRVIISRNMRWARHITRTGG